MRYTIQEELGTKSDGATNVNLKTQPYPNAHTLCLQHVCAINRNSNDMDVDIGVIVGGAIQWITTLVCEEDGSYFHWAGEVFVRSCKQVILRCRGTNDEDNIEAYVYGYYLA